MTKKEKKGILILILVAVLIIVILVIVKRPRVEEEPTNIADVNVEKYVEVLDDGTRLNTSEKLQGTKKVGNLEITNLQLTALDNKTTLLGTITNVGSKQDGNVLLNIKIIDDQGKELTTVPAYIGIIEPGQSTQLNVQPTLDYANAYDFVVTIAQ